VTVAIAEGVEEVAGRLHRTLRTLPDRPPAVLLLHGWGDSADCWRPVLRRLADAGVPALAVDLPGYGTAGAAPRGPALDRLDRFVGEVTGELDEPVLLAGYSLGGLLALRAAADERRTLSGAVAMAPPGVASSWLQSACAHAAPFVNALVRVPVSVPVPSRLVREVAGQCYRAVVAVGDELTAEQLRHYTSHWKDHRAFARQVGAMADLLVELRGLDPIDPPRCPVVTLWGEKDTLVPPSAAGRLRDLHPDVDVEIVPRAGHVLPLEAPDRVATVLAERAWWVGAQATPRGTPTRRGRTSGRGADAQGARADGGQRPGPGASPSSAPMSSVSSPP